MTLSVARDLAAIGVRVNRVAPGPIDTRSYGEGDSQPFKDKLKRGLLSRSGQGRRTSGPHRH